MNDKELIKLKIIITSALIILKIKDQKSMKNLGNELLNEGTSKRKVMNYIFSKNTPYDVFIKKP
jgi:hypothetical protein